MALAVKSFSAKHAYRDITNIFPIKAALKKLFFALRAG
jgi:hypothetical protein